MKKDYSNILELLQKHFPGFDPEVREIIAQNGFIKEISAGEIVMRTGQYFRSVMLVVKGRVKVYREDDEGSEMFMYYIEPGKACALSMICAAKKEASEITAKTYEDTLMVAIPLQLMDELMRNNRSWYYFVLESYRSRFEELLETLENVAFKSMDERLEFYLKKQQKVLQNNELKITHEQIAKDLNSSRVVISRLLKRMEEDKKVKLFRNAILIENI